MIEKKTTEQIVRDECTIIKVISDKRYKDGKPINIIDICPKSKNIEWIGVEDEIRRWNTMAMLVENNSTRRILTTYIYEKIDELSSSSEVQK